LSTTLKLSISYRVEQHEQWELPMLKRRVGWQPSRFLTDRAEAERAYALAEQLGSVNATATQLGHHLAVAAQGLHPPRAGHAHPQP
jgi:hypothetical protein